MILSLCSWQCKKQTIVATSTTEAEYVAAAHCCGQVLWIQNQMLDYGFNFMNTQIFIDNESTISIVKNPVYHSKTKHIEIRHHFIRDSYEKKLIQVLKIHTDDNVADLLTKAFDGPRFNFLVTNFFRKSMDLKLDGSCDDDDLSHIWLLMLTATVRTIANGNQELLATIDSKAYTITEASVRSSLQLADATGITNLPDAEIHEGLATMGGFEGNYVPLLPAMLAPAQGKGSTIPAGSQPTPTGPTLTPVADEATTTSVEVDAEGAATTTASLEAGLDSGNIHESPLRSHDAPLPEVNTSGSAEDSVQLKELMELVPKLVLRIDSLEKELTKTTQIFGNEVLTLKNRVKTLEVALKRKSKKVVLSESEGEEAENSSKQGRKSQDDRSEDFITPSNSGEAQEQDISPTLLDAANTLTQVASGGVSTYKRRRRSVDTGMDYFSAAKERTKSEEVNTGSTGVNTGSTPDKAQRKGKAKMVEENVQTVQKTKKQLEQEKAGFAEGVRLQAQLDAEVAEQIYTDEMIAKRMEEETEMTDQQKQRMAQVQFEAQYYTEEDWDVIRAKLEANAELVKNMQGEGLSEEDFAKRMVDMINQRKKYFAEERAKAKRSKPMTQTQLRTYMSNYLKNQGTWKLSQLKKLTFEEIKEKFDKLVNQIDTFVPMGSAESQEKVATKNIVVTEEKDGETTVPKEEEEEDSKIDKEEDMEAIGAIPVATKSPSVVNWKIFQQGQRSIYQIIRANGADTIYMSFRAMLKDITRDDLIELYRVHCLTLEVAVIYMLTERKYPLSSDACQAMLDMKHQGGKQNKECYQLLKLIEKQRYSQNSKAYIILNKHTRKIKESLNVTFDETPPPSKTSPLVDDNLDEEEEIKVTKKKNLENNIEDETLEIDEMVNIKESRNHPLENVIGNLNQRTLRLVAQGYNQQEGINYDETYAIVARLESIRILLAYACALDFKLFQMDVKSAFLNGFINEEVYVAQPPGFIDFEKPDHVYKLKKALYGLKQASKAWYDRLKAFLIKHKYKMGMVDNTLFTKKKSSNLIIVQIYVDDIIFGLTCQDMCDEFAKIMHDEFEMSMMGELNFFLGLQIKQMEDGIFFNQSKYIKEMLKKFGLE
ncbi:retrovirus-related pol polyprotein from transposon TNT 1-94 [Tanacetum coccineum]